MNNSSINCNVLSLLKIPRLKNIVKLKPAPLRENVLSFLVYFKKYSKVVSMDLVEIAKPDQTCTVDNPQFGRHDDAQIFTMPGEDLSHERERWQTIYESAFSLRELENMETIGRRRDLIKRIISERVWRELQTPEITVEDATNPSEYNDNFCDPEFVPFLDKPATDESLLTKYPLYASNNQTIYKDQIDRGGLKSRAEISNLNEPFRKNCTFTTSPEYALREPTGGF